MARVKWCLRVNVNSEMSKIFKIELRITLVRKMSRVGAMFKWLRLKFHKWRQSDHDEVIDGTSMARTYWLKSQWVNIAVRTQYAKEVSVYLFIPIQFIFCLIKLSNWAWIVFVDKCVFSFSNDALGGIDPLHRFGFFDRELQLLQHFTLTQFQSRSLQ